jgi:hypothetical protein
MWHNVICWVALHIPLECVTGWVMTYPVTKWHIPRGNQSSTTLFWKHQISFAMETLVIRSVHELMKLKWQHYTPSYQSLPITSKSMQWLVRLVTSFSACRPRFNTRPVYVGIVVDKAGLRQVFLPKSFSFSCLHEPFNAPYTFIYL